MEGGIVRLHVEHSRILSFAEWWVYFGRVAMLIIITIALASSGMWCNRPSNPLHNNGYSRPSPLLPHMLYRLQLPFTSFAALHHCARDAAEVALSATGEGAIDTARFWARWFEDRGCRAAGGGGESHVDWCGDGGGRHYIMYRYRYRGFDLLPSDVLIQRSAFLVTSLYGVCESYQRVSGVNNSIARPKVCLQEELSGRRLIYRRCTQPLL